MIQYWLLPGLHRDRAVVDLNPIWRQKHAPCFAQYGFGGIIFIANLQSSPPFDSATFTNYIAGPLALMRHLSRPEIG
jgi:hypothetical protein